MTDLRLYNSLTKKIEQFTSLKKGKVSMYVCGITPDAETHLGHAFTYLTFDVLIRLLKFSGYEVSYLQNLTDIDDDILKRSAKAGRDWKEFGDHFMSVFLENMEKLSWTKPDNYVRATGSIPTIIEIASRLIDKGFAYEVDGTVYFEVKKFPSYGKLSGFNHDEMIKFSSERGGDINDRNKRDPLDFILWQKAKEGEPTWDSPWGKGRPGWHIECSSMIYDYLDPQIDIHGGGADLIYPHHESEIAQSESFTGLSPFSKFFMHVVYLKYQGEKMSKSLGNLVMVSELLKNYSADAIRFLLLSHHYRSSWEYTQEEMDEAAEKVELLKKRATDSREAPDDMFLELLKNDLDTPKALEFLSSGKADNIGADLRLLGFKI